MMKVLGACLAATVLAGSAWAGPPRADSPINLAPGSENQPVARVEIDLAAGRAIRTLSMVPGIPLGGGVTVDLELEPAGLLGAGGRIVVAGAQGERDLDVSELVILRGRVAGDENSIAVFGLSPWFAHGYVRTADAMYVLSSGPVGSGLPPVVFDVREMAGEAAAEFICGSEDPAFDPLGVLEHPAEPAPGAGERGAGAPCRVASIAVDTHWEFTQDFGGNAAAAGAYAMFLMAAVSEIYERDVNTRLAVTYLRIWEENVDPYNTTDIFVMLDTFRAHWRDNMQHVPRTLAHMLSTRNLSGAGGVAYVGVFCNNSFGYGLSAHLNASFPYPLATNNGGNWDLVVTAHELGHQFGTGHTHSAYTPPVDNCGNGDCSAAFGGTIMSYCHTCSGGISNIDLRFHERVIDRILQYIDNNAPCAIDGDPIAADDYATTLAGRPQAVDVLFNDAVCGAPAIAAFDAVSVGGGAVALSIGTGAAGQDELVYTPAPGFSGWDEFGYQIGGSAATAHVLVELPRPADATGPTAPGVNVDYYDLVAPEALPDFGLLSAFASDVVGQINFPSTGGTYSTSQRSDNFGAVYSAFIEVQGDGYYTLSTDSDDGSRLWVGDTLVVENDGLHGMRIRSGQIGLAAGKHAVRVEFFEAGGGAGLIVRYAAEGGPDAAVPAGAWSHAVACPGDFNGDGARDTSDFFEFFAGFFASPPAADYNGDGSTDTSDFFEFFADFFGPPCA